MPVQYDPSPIFEGLSSAGRSLTRGIEQYQENRRERNERLRRQMIANSPEFRDYEDIKRAIIDGTMTIAQARVMAKERRAEKEAKEAAKKAKKLTDKLVKGAATDEELGEAIELGLITPNQATDRRQSRQKSEATEAQAEGIGSGTAMERVNNEPNADLMSQSEKISLARLYARGEDQSEEAQRIRKSAEQKKTQQVVQESPQGTFATPFDRALAATGRVGTARRAPEAEPYDEDVMKATIDNAKALVDSPERVAARMSQAADIVDQLNKAQKLGNSDALDELARRFGVTGQDYSIHSIARQLRQGELNEAKKAARLEVIGKQLQNDGVSDATVTALMQTLKELQDELSEIVSRREQADKLLETMSGGR